MRGALRVPIFMAFASGFAATVVAACVGDDPGASSPPDAAPDAVPDSPVIDGGSDTSTVPDAGSGFCARASGATACADFDEDNDPVPQGWTKEEVAGGSLLLVGSDRSAPFALQSRLVGADAGPQSAIILRTLTFASGKLDLRIEAEVRVNTQGAPVPPATKFLHVTMSPTSFFNIALTGTNQIAAAVVKQVDAGFAITDVASSTPLTPKVWHHFVVTIVQEAAGNAAAQVTLDGVVLNPGNPTPVAIPRADGPDLLLRPGAETPGASGAVEIDFDNILVTMK